MGEMKEFQCTYDNSAGISGEVTEGLNLTFPDAYLHRDTMAVLSKALKEYDNAAFCELPFSAGRIHEVLMACKMLKGEGEHVVMQVSGPFTVLNVLIDAKYVYKALRKKPELMKEVFRKLGGEIFKFMEEAKRYGADLISYADASGGLNILGPKMVEQVVEDFTYEFLKRSETLADDRTMILLCPKTTFALLGTEKASFREHKLSRPMAYGEGCIEMTGKVKIAGQMCIKNVGYQLENAVLKEVVLV